MNEPFSVEGLVIIFSTIISIIISFLIIRLNWKRYGLLFLLSSFTGYFICYVFVKLEYYHYPYTLLPNYSLMPITAITTVFPFIVITAVCFSPKEWKWKIPFYWTIVHAGMSFEIWAIRNTTIIEFLNKWDAGNSYASWWIYLLIFQVIGERIIPEKDTYPINSEKFRFTNIFWIISHVILIGSFYYFGYHTGAKM
ncbi:hypothetical protein IM538_08050 [Cytobacillus suaedae]|nr:hypothetical protein IM538_08050 [Cytobacillus suaedae]